MMDADFFKDLLESGENELVDYKQEPYFLPGKNKNTKIQNAEFAKDMISMANTVRDESAYILIGVKEEDGKGVAIGIDKIYSIDGASLRQKLEALTDPIINFKYFPFYYEGKRIDIIELPVCWYSSPVKPTKTVGAILNKREIYVRHGDKNGIASHEDHVKLNAWLSSITKLQEINSSKRSKNKVKLSGFQFTEENIQKLFGNEAAEDEDPKRLKEYYFKNDTYERINVDLPLRILVGHKGIGKSALFKVSFLEDKESYVLPIWIKPDDVVGIADEINGFLKMVRAWKEGLYRIILNKVLSFFRIRKKVEIDLDFVGEDIGGYIKDLLAKEINIDLLDENSIEFYNKFMQLDLIHVYIDDLDRGWSGSRADISKISTLLNAVRDISNTNRGIQFKISLRSDVYYLVRTSDESTDKIEGSVIWYRWDYTEILALLVKRVNTFFGVEINEVKLKSSHQGQLATYLDRIIEPRFSGNGKWENREMYKVLLSVIRKRPRDLVKLLTLAARNSRKRGSNYITTLDFQEIFDKYSLDRIQDTVNEYKSELKDIERLILGMKPSRSQGKSYKDRFYYTTGELLKKINDIKERGEFRINNRTATARELAGFLYKVNFITATKKLPSGVIDRKDFEENKYLVPKFEDFGYDWEVHMAFRWALKPSEQENIFYEF